MTNAPFQTPEEATLITKPTPVKVKADEVDPVLLDWNRADLEPFALEKEEDMKQVELRKIVPQACEDGHEDEHGQLVKRLEELRHALGDAWKSMEQTVDEAVKSISSGRDL